MPISPTSPELLALILSELPDNDGQLITPAKLSGVLNNVISSLSDYANSDNLTQGAINLFLTSAERTKLTGVSASAEPNAAAVTQAEAEAGTSTALKTYSPIRVAQAIASLSSVRARLSHTLVNASFTATKGIRTPITSAGGVVDVTPPASPVAGDQFGVVDAARSFATNPCNVRFNSAGQKYCGADVNLALTVIDTSVVFEFVSAATGWVIVSGSAS